MSDENNNLSSGAVIVDLGEPMGHDPKIGMKNVKWQQHSESWGGL